MAFLRREGILARSLSEDRWPEISLSVITTHLYLSLIKPCCKSDLISVTKFVASCVLFIATVRFGRLFELSNSVSRFKVPIAGAVNIT